MRKLKPFSYRSKCFALLLYELYANVSSLICPFLAGRPQFHSNHRVNVSTPRYWQSATFGRLTFCVYPLLFLRNSRLISPRPYDIKSKRISHRHSCNVYMRSLCGSCPADVATAARPRTATHDYGRFYSYI